MTQTPSRLPGTGDMLCFALYSANHAMTRLYRPLLQPLGLTYPQYLVLVALWSEDERRVGALGEELGLDTNTLTPLLKRMAEAGLVTRGRSAADERVVTVRLTDKGRALEAEAERITTCVFEATGLSVEELADLRDRIARLNTEIAEHL
ncbi:MarR family transcriptional regulator [Pseudooceanicola nanhaiensis]|uniref:MarR family transcriptional regulator n=1 Tax=Pseudooceanicola nanhaiensis TaxID=375761 RepID=A0A917T1N0_9RHOB|nr:MarR family transcriptional regulator [Pseudooceanicola nanhaiensis]GGM07362.1 MarR family transcriptional regulator [Pseudooceanicola nanhaiensis]